MMLLPARLAMIDVHFDCVRFGSVEVAIDPRVKPLQNVGARLEFSTLRHDRAPP